MRPLHVMPSRRQPLFIRRRKPDTLGRHIRLACIICAAAFAAAWLVTWLAMEISHVS